MFSVIRDWDAGGLLSHATDVPHLFRRLAAYADKILRGADSATLPVEQPTKFDLTINLKTAKALGGDDSSRAAAAGGSDNRVTHPPYFLPGVRVLLLVRSITSTQWGHEAWPEVKPLLHRALEMRRQIAWNGWCN